MPLVGLRRFFCFSLRFFLWLVALLPLTSTRAEVVQAEPPAPPPAAARAEAAGDEPLGPLVLRTGGGRHSVRVALAAQLRLTEVSTLSDPSAGWANDTTLAVRRLWPSLRASFFSERIEVLLQLSTLPGALELLDLYADFVVHRQLRLRIGQTKVPFTRYRLQSFSMLTLADWAIVARTFGAERQLGIALHNGYERPPRLGYSFGVFSGVNARRSFALGLGNAYAEPLPNPSDLSGPSLPAAVHPELVGQISYNSAGMQVGSDHDAERGPLRISTGLSGAWDLRPTEAQDFTGRFAAELLAKYRGLSVTVIGYLGLFDAHDGQGIRPAMIGALAQAAWALHPRLELALRYARVSPRTALIAAARTRGAQLIEAASEPARAAIIKQYGAAGQVVDQHESTFGLNVYLRGHTLKAQADVNWLHLIYDGPPREEVRLRLQGQVLF